MYGCHCAQREFLAVPGLPDAAKYTMSIRNFTHMTWDNASVKKWNEWSWSWSLRPLEDPGELVALISAKKVCILVPISIGVLRSVLSPAFYKYQSLGLHRFEPSHWLRTVTSKPSTYRCRQLKGQQFRLLALMTLALMKNFREEFSKNSPCAPREISILSSEKISASFWKNLAK